jgi:hypothetical protein
MSEYEGATTRMDWATSDFLLTGDCEQPAHNKADSTTNKTERSIDGIIAPSLEQTVSRMFVT